MATRDRTRGVSRQARQAANRAAKLEGKGGAAPGPDAAKDRVATADEVRTAGERAAKRWAGLLQRLGE